MAKKGKAKATTRKSAPQSQPKSQSSRQPKAKARPQEPSSSRRSSTPQNQPSVTMPFARMNYLLMIGGVAIIALGFILMSFDPFIDATQFSISLYIAPPIVIFGFLGIIYAIMYRDSSQQPTPDSTVGAES